MDTYQGHHPLINVRNITGLTCGALGILEFNVSQIRYISDGLGGRHHGWEVSSPDITGDKGSRTQQKVKAAGGNNSRSQGRPGGALFLEHTK